MTYIFKNLWVLENESVTQKYSDLCLNMVSGTHTFLPASSRRLLTKMIVRRFFFSSRLHT